MKVRHKGLLGVFLCLSVAMVVCAIIRISGYTHNGLIDETWLFLWAAIEADVAVIMISLTAFRSIFLARTIQKPRQRRLNVWKTITRRRAKKATNEEPQIKLAIPKPTMTGIRTFIRGGKETTQPSSITKATHSTDPSTTLQSYGGDSIFDDSWRAEKRTPRYQYNVV